MGPRRHFHKTMSSPYFQSKHYLEESNGGKMEAKIIKIIRKIWKKKI